MFQIYILLTHMEGTFKRDPNERAHVPRKRQSVIPSHLQAVPEGEETHLRSRSAHARFMVRGVVYPVAPSALSCEVLSRICIDNDGMFHRVMPVIAACS